MQRHTAAVAINVRLAKPCAGDRKAANLDDIPHGNNQQHDPEVKALYNVGARQLKQVVLFEALEDGALDLHKLVRQQQRQQRVRVRVDGDVERDDLVVERDRVQAVVRQREEEHAEREQNLGSARRVPRQRLGAEEALENVLPDGGEQAVADLEDVEDDVELNGRLRADKVVHAAGVELHKRKGAAEDDGTLEQVGLVVGREVGGHRLCAAMAKAA